MRADVCSFGNRSMWGGQGELQEGGDRASPGGAGRRGGGLCSPSQRICKGSGRGRFACGGLIIRPAAPGGEGGREGSVGRRAHARVRPAARLRRGR
jgi:hypothetical protein